MTGDRRPDRIVDAVGLLCPLPVIRTGKAVAEMRVGEVLELIADDRGVLADIPDWCTGHGHSYLGNHTEGRVYHLYLRKGRRE